MKKYSLDEQVELLYNAKLLKKKLSDVGPIEESDVISYCVSNELVVQERFYSRMAKTFDLDYTESIPHALNPGKEIVNQIPITLLQKYIVYPIEQNGNLVLITYTPFLKEDVVKRILSYTTYEKAKLMIANPILIRDELEDVHHIVADIISDEQQMTTNPLESVSKYGTQSEIKYGWVIPIVISVLIFVLFPIPTLVFLFISVNLIYFLINPFKLYTFIHSFSDKQTLTFSRSQVKAVEDKDLPVYTVLVPLRFEANIARNIVRNIAKLDYPKDKLDVKFIMNIDDQTTLEAVRSAGIGVVSEHASASDFWAHVVEAPSTKYTTKPRVCNYALTFAKGMLTVIYDAEDKPDPDQLKKAYLGFLASSLDTICLQSKLNFYNRNQNTLTRLFALEYGFWFEYFLPGLQQISSPIPLGGTSNHFLTGPLRKLGTWDPYNVTEDADLGLRIARHNFRTRVLESHTLEEANSQVWNWIKQRTRWQKGFLQTFVIHMKHPVRLLQQLGPVRFMYAMVTFGANFFLPYLNPFLWVIFLVSLAELILGRDVLPIPMLLEMIALFNLVFGNLMYLVIHMIAAIRLRWNDLIPFVILMPLYWAVLSIATHRAFFQYIFKPYVWEKTTHGLHLKDGKNG